MSVKKILIYKDEGVSPGGVYLLPETLREIFDSSKIGIEQVSAEFIVHENWEKEAAAFIMPGGADLYYLKKLHGEGNRKVRSFVENGGIYIGFCAGAYYGASSIEFDKGTQFEVCGERELKFYSGKAIGPAFGSGTYFYNSEEGAKLVNVKVDTLKKEFCIYYNGGCFFTDATNPTDFEVLARYTEIEGKPAAVIKCKVGKGEALLSGVHPEYQAESLNLITENKLPFSRLLIEKESERAEFLNYILSNTKLKNYLT